MRKASRDSGAEQSGAAAAFNRFTGRRSSLLPLLGKVVDVCCRSYELRREGRWRGWIPLGENFKGLVSGQQREEKWGRNNTSWRPTMETDWGMSEGAYGGSRRRMNKGPFGRQCDISKLLADPLPGLASEEAVFLLLESA